MSAPLAPPSTPLRRPDPGHPGLPHPDLSHPDLSHPDLHHPAPGHPDPGHPGPPRTIRAAGPARHGLQLEWERVRRDPAAVSAARSWRVVEVDFDDLDQLLGLAGFERPGTSDTDRVLLDLVLRARTEQLAARIVLQRLLPGLLAQVRRRRRAGRDDAFEELVASAWVVIREYDPRRRPACLAAALITGADYLAFGRAERRPDPAEPMAPDRLDERVDHDHRTALDELAELIAEARTAGVSETDLDLVRGLVSVGSPSGLAAELGVTPRTIRNRRDRALHQLRRVGLAA